MNILLTSVGRRVKVVQYFKKEFNWNGGKVIAADCDKDAPALCFADQGIKIPPIKNDNYLSSIISVCRDYDIDAIVSLIDPELEILAKNKSHFDEIEVKLLLSSLNMIQNSFDKQKTYYYLNELEIPAVPTFSEINDIEWYLEKEDYQYPLIVKPKNG